MMHIAPRFGKCLSHHSARYSLGMPDTAAADRLRAARAKAGFDTAKEAAEAMGVAVASYIQHENGTRGFRRDSAEKYARRFRVSPEWLMLGRGNDAAPVDSVPDASTLEQMVREIIDSEYRVEMRLADLPRMLGTALHEQLELLRAGHASRRNAGEGTAPGTGAQSPLPTS